MRLLHISISPSPLSSLSRLFHRFFSLSLPLHRLLPPPVADVVCVLSLFHSLVSVFQSFFIHHGFQFSHCRHCRGFFSHPHCIGLQSQCNDQCGYLLCRPPWSCHNMANITRAKAPTRKDSPISVRKPRWISSIWVSSTYSPTRA